MSITAAEIQNVRFGEARRGYNPDEVDDFLEKVATDVDTLNRALAEAAIRLRDAEERAREAEQKLSSADLRAPVAPVVSAAEPGITEDVISKAFIAAQLSADKLKEEARKEAEKLYREADSKAKDIVREAYGERERVLGEIDHLRAVSEKFRTEFLSLVNHYSTDAQKRFSAFGELVPADPNQAVLSGVEALFETNNAVVSPGSGGQSDARAERTGGSRARHNTSSDLGATTMMPSAAFALDDDLEIEEID